MSDSSGDKQQATGHRSAAMVAVYDRKLAEVKPAGEKTYLILQANVIRLLQVRLKVGKI
jgi:hypothetical protein